MTCVVSNEPEIKFRVTLGLIILNTTLYILPNSTWQGGKKKRLSRFIHGRIENAEVSLTFKSEMVVGSWCSGLSFRGRLVNDYQYHFIRNLIFVLLFFFLVYLVILRE